MKDHSDEKAETEKRLIRQIHDLGGELGMKLDDLENVSDAENYEYQVATGLAEAVAQIFERDPFKAVSWFGLCLISCDVEVDDRVGCLLDSLKREIDEQDEAFEGDESQDAEK